MYHFILTMYRHGASKQTCLVRKEWRSELNFFMHVYIYVDLSSYSFSSSSSSFNSGSSMDSPNSSNFAIIFWMPLSSSCTMCLKLSSISPFLSSTCSNPFTSFSCDSLISFHFGVNTCFTHFAMYLRWSFISSG